MTGHAALPHLVSLYSMRGGISGKTVRSNALFLESAEPVCQCLGTDVVEDGTQLAKSARAAEKLADDEQRPLSIEDADGAFDRAAFLSHGLNHPFVQLRKLYNKCLLRRARACCIMCSNR